MSNWYCTFNAAGGAHELEGLRKVLDELWSRVEIKRSSQDSASVHTIQGGLLADGRSSVETMVARFPALSFNGTLCTTRYREYEWTFEGRSGATAWQTSYDEEIAETDARIDAYYAAFREAELRTARQEELRAAEDGVDAAELEQRIEKTLKRTLGIFAHCRNSRSTSSLKKKKAIMKASGRPDALQP